MKPNTPIQKTRSTAALCARTAGARKPGAAAPGRRQQRARLAGALLALALSGCASESALRRADPGFTAAGLREGGLAVLGAVQVDEVTQARPPLIAALERVLAGARPDLRVLPAARVQAALGDSAMRLFLLGYQLRGEPDSVWLARASGALAGLARYGVLARVESAPIRYGTRIVSGMARGQYEDREVTAAGRDARLSMVVYDLKTRSVVYEADLIGSADAVPDLKPPSPGDTLLPENAPRPERGRPVVYGGSAYPPLSPGDSPRELGYPEPPTVARASESAFLEFARMLPGGPPGAAPASR